MSSAQHHRRTSRTPLAATALAAVCALTLSACGSADDVSSHSAVATSPSPAESGTVLDHPFTKPDLVLTGTDGLEYNLVEQTRSRPTLLYFGYTNCPDVCPLTMSNIAIALKRLSPADRKKLRVVFITSDPERDTPKRLGSWLRGQDPSFIGLTGDFSTIQTGARSVGVSIEPPQKDKDDSIVSSHSVGVLAFSPKDDKAHVIYSEETTADDYTKELPKIIKGVTS